MELEEMKSLWTEMSLQIEKQKKLTDSLVIRMTRLNFRGKLKSIIIPEAVSSICCFFIVIYILINFQNLHIWYLRFCGIITLVLLILLPVLSFKSIYHIRAINISEMDYKQTLLEFSKARIQFAFIQKLNLLLGAVLLVVCLPAMGQLITGMDFFKETRLWMGYAIAFPFWYIFARWVYKYYIRVTLQAEHILEELNN